MTIKIPGFPSEELKKSIEGLNKIRLPEPQLSKESPVRLPPNPAFKTNAEIEKLNGQMETLVGAMTKLAAATVQMIWLTVAILLVALAGLGLSVYLALG